MRLPSKYGKALIKKQGQMVHQNLVPITMSGLFVSEHDFHSLLETRNSVIV